MNLESIAQNNPNPESSPQGIWQHLPEETPEAFSAFAIYLEFGSDATLRDVAEKTGKSLGAIANLDLLPSVAAVLTRYTRWNI